MDNRRSTSRKIYVLRTIASCCALVEQIVTLAAALQYLLKNLFTVVVVATRPLPRDGSMAEDHGASEAKQFPRAWTRDRKETESRQRESGVKSS